MSEDEISLEIAGPPPKPLDETISLSEVVLAALRKYHAKSIAQVEVETGRELTYGHLVRESLSVVQGLKAEGVDENSMVCLVSYNSQECHVMLLAAMFLGATVAPIDPSLTPDELANLLDLIAPSVLYTEGGKTLRKVESAVALLSFSPLLVVSGRHKHSYISFQSLHQPTDPEFRPKISDPKEHVAFILCTSGTSGLPKGVMLTDLYVLFNISPVPRQPDQQTVLLLTSPIFWLSGIVMFFISVINGLKMVFLRGPAKETVLLSTIQTYKPKIWFTSPTTLIGMLSLPGRGAYDLSSIMMATCGGAALGADSQVRIQKEVFRNRVPVLQGYGMTEMGIITSTVPQLSKPGSCGVLRPGMKCKIEDLETGEKLPANREGEMCIKGTYIMKGYLNNPEATAATFDVDGWFHTGDIGYYDEDGFIFIVDRLKDLIKYKTYQIAPAEIENVLRTHPAVKDCAVFGIPHQIDGDHATAYVVALSTVSENQLKEFVAERVSETKKLRGGIRFVEFIPRTSTGKPKRRALRAQRLAELQGLKAKRLQLATSSTTSTTTTRVKKTIPNRLLHSHNHWFST